MRADIPLHFNERAAFLEVASVDVLSLGTIAGQRLAVARGRSPNKGNGFTSEHPLEDAFMLGVQLVDYEGELSVDGTTLPLLRQRAGAVATYDYRRHWRANLLSPFDCINFHLPRAALNAVAEEEEIRTIDVLRLNPGETMDDPVAMGLTQALLPLIAKPSEAEALFVSHVGQALCIHVARTYGAGERRRATKQGLLAPWQERRTKEMIVANLAGDVTLADLAAECGLSVSHFARSFRRTTGVPPHQWLLLQRVERAKTLLLDARNTIADIATMCGFADQSHLSRVFVRAVGRSPAAWRRDAIV